MPFCRSCNAEIIWQRMQSGKMMPLDPPLLTVITDAGETVRGRISHFSTCPHAAEHRKTQEQQEAGA